MLLDQLDSELARNNGPWLLGNQYTALDATMATLTTQSSYITQQIAAWNSNKN